MKKIIIFLILIIAISIYANTQDYSVLKIEATDSFTDNVIVCKNITITNDSIIFMDNKQMFEVSNFWEIETVTYYDLYYNDSIPVEAILSEKSLILKYDGGKVKYTLE
jgi:hypothetical protein